MVVTILTGESLRDRKKLAAMKRVQWEAVRRFVEVGFDKVTVEEIADAADVSAVSVYRWFGTKDGIVIWDEFDPPILDTVAERLATEPPLDAVRNALVALLDRVYDRERSLALERVRLIFKEPTLRAASERNMRALRRALERQFCERAGMTELHARVTAGVAVGLLEIGIERWQLEDGRRQLGVLITEAFEALAAATRSSRPVPTVGLS
ncbi:MAG: TetR/AcrR family transcriptional regulator [Egibacteraceae bacterium]